MSALPAAVGCITFRMPREPAPTTGLVVLRDRTLTGLVRHALAFGARSLSGLVIGVVGLLVIIGEQWADDDSSGASGSEPPAVIAWFLFAVIALGLIAALVATVGPLLGFDRARRLRAGRRSGTMVLALLIAAPGPVAVLGGVIVLVAMGFRT